ncbi:MAG: hypothetical protein V3S30_05105 [Thermoanaerobaculia bacterium]
MATLHALTAAGRPRCRCDAFGLAGCPECQAIAERRARAELRRRADETSDKTHLARLTEEVSQEGRT